LKFQTAEAELEKCAGVQKKRSQTIGQENALPTFHLVENLLARTVHVNVVQSARAASLTYHRRKIGYFPLKSHKRRWRSIVKALFFSS
jgi:hypothetical protein